MKLTRQEALKLLGQLRGLQQNYIEADDRYNWGARSSAQQAGDFFMYLEDRIEKERDGNFRWIRLSDLTRMSKENEQELKKRAWK